METLVVVVVALWALRRLIVDGAFAVRGQTPPTMARRQSGRYGMRGYLGDVWSDAWRSANDRRVSRREARAAGQPRFARLARARAVAGAWWRSAGGSRQYRRRGGKVTEELRPGAWDRAWDAVAQRRAAKAARRAAADDAPALPAQRLDQVEGRRVRASSPRPSAPARPVPATDGRTYRSGNAHREPMGVRPVDGERQDAPNPGAAPAGTPGAAPERDRPNGPVAATINPPAQPDRHNRKEGNGMAEATGLTSAIGYAGAQSEAARGNVGEIESWVASLEAHEVTGEAIAQARQAMEQYQAAGAAFDRAREALNRHLQVKEAYDANQDAGSREFVTSE